MEAPVQGEPRLPLCQDRRPDVPHTGQRTPDRRRGRRGDPLLDPPRRRVGLSCEAPLRERGFLSDALCADSALHIVGIALALLRVFPYPTLLGSSYCFGAAL